MRRCSLFLLMCLASGLFAQIQVLPDLEVTGESNVRIFLYKKALPYSYDSTLADSLAYFLPMSLPAAEKSEVLLHVPTLRHYLHLEAGSRFDADAHYRYHPAHQSINALGIRGSFKAPKSKLLSRHTSLLADLSRQEDFSLRTQAHYFINEATASRSEYLMGQMLLSTDGIRVSGMEIPEMTNEIRLHQLKQNNLNIEYSSDGLAWYHNSKLDLGRFALTNAIHLYSPRAVIHSGISLPSGFFDSSSVHVIYDGYHLMPSLGFSYHTVPGFDQMFTIANEPISIPNDYHEMLERYRWVDQQQSRRNTSLPLNLSLRYELVNPEGQSFQFSGLELINRSRYYKYRPLLRDGIANDVPELYFGDVFENSSMVSAQFTEASFSLKQTIEVSLAYLPNQSWIRQAYNPLLNVATTAVLDKAPFHASLSLEQRFSSRDEQLRNMPEILDLKLRLAYDIGHYSEAYLVADNILNSPIREHRALPKKGSAVFVGLVHRF